MANVAINPNTDPLNPLSNAGTAAPAPPTPSYTRAGQPGYNVNDTTPAPNYARPGQPSYTSSGPLETKTDPPLTAGPASWQTELGNFQTMADKTAADLAKGGFDPAQQDRYYQEAKAPIE